MIKQYVSSLLENKGKQHIKSDKLPEPNRGLSISSQSLSAKDHTVNINLFYCDLVLLAVMVGLLLFP